jgi:hypothetical protein
MREPQLGEQVFIGGAVVRTRGFDGENSDGAAVDFQLPDGQLVQTSALNIVRADQARPDEKAVSDAPSNKAVTGAPSNKAVRPGANK